MNKISIEVKCETKVRSARFRTPWRVTILERGMSHFPRRFSKDKYELNISIQIRSRVTRRYLCAGERGPSFEIAERGGLEATQTAFAVDSVCSLLARSRINTEFAVTRRVQRRHPEVSFTRKWEEGERHVTEGAILPGDQMLRKIRRLPTWKFQSTVWRQRLVLFLLLLLTCHRTCIRDIRNIS